MSQSHEVPQEELELAFAEAIVADYRQAVEVEQAFIRVTPEDLPAVMPAQPLGRTMVELGSAAVVGGAILAQPVAASAAMVEKPSTVVVADAHADKTNDPYHLTDKDRQELETLGLLPNESTTVTKPDKALEQLLTPNPTTRSSETKPKSIEDIFLPDSVVDALSHYKGVPHNHVEVEEQTHHKKPKHAIHHLETRAPATRHTKHAVERPSSVETVKLESTVWAIAKELVPAKDRHDDKVIAEMTNTILKLNHISPKEATDLPAGKEIVVPARKLPVHHGVDVEVKPGETLSGILARHGINPTPENIKRLHVKHPNLIYPGQHIHIPAYMVAKVHPTHITHKHPAHHKPVRHEGTHHIRRYIEVTKVPHSVVLKAVEEMKALGNNEHTNWTNISKVLQFFIGKGLSPEQAAAIAGNFKTESGVDPSKHQYGAGPGRGLAQWEVGGRWDALVKWANHHGLDPLSLGAQIEYTWHELKTSHSQALHELKKAKTLAQATVAFEKYFEGAGIPHMTVRVEAATHIYQAVVNHVEQIVTSGGDNAPGVNDAPAPQSGDTPASSEADTPDSNGSGARFQAHDVQPGTDAAPEQAPPVAITSNVEQCPDGTTDLGMHDGGIYGEKLALHLCAINSLPSSSEESTPGSRYYIDGANGNAIVSVEIAAKVVQMVQDAAAAGVHLKAVSSFRTWEHQFNLWSSSDQSGATVGEPGESNHNGAVAIDFDLDGLPISASSYTTSDGNSPSADNPRIAPNSDSWKWLHDNASKYGLQQYFNEPWHFSVDGH
ncbi:MAG TPA: phage tail tip lysozyme [Candidatus Saccharimonadales bacterium]|nr:phage tail tip lysozyme [Candidatus Saccharimonadales bacterium]